MKYSNFLGRLKSCPFCKIHPERIIYEGVHASLIIAIAPYHKDHLLVVPKVHSTSALRVGLGIDSVIRVGIRLLEKRGHKGVSVLMRNGMSTGKSINHLHYHLIPDIPIGPLSMPKEKLKDRDIIKNSSELRKVKDFRKILQTLKF